MKILVLGGDGMLGHQLLKSLSQRHSVAVTLRQPLVAYAGHGIFTATNTFDRVDVRDFPRVGAVLREARPDAVVNGVGIVKQRPDVKAAIPSLEINALLPHRLLDVCREMNARFIHMSTDCVFSGNRGDYRETDRPDPVDLYGHTKLLGEVSDAPGVTLRTSIIGLELARKTGLIEWFLAQRGPIRGFRRAIYTGLTTREMARVIERVLTDHPTLHGLWQVASAPITKHDLLHQLASELERTDITIEPDDSFYCDRSLRGNAFAGETGYRAPSWETMLKELAADIRSRTP